MPREVAEIVVDLVIETKVGESDQGAILVTEDGGKTKVWLPKSLVSWSRKNKHNILDSTIIVVAPVRLLHEKKFAGF